MVGEGIDDGPGVVRGEERENERKVAGDGESGDWVMMFAADSSGPSKKQGGRKEGGGGRQEKKKEPLPVFNKISPITPKASR